MIDRSDPAFFSFATAKSLDAIFPPADGAALKLDQYGRVVWTTGNGGRAEPSVSSNADRPLHAAALVNQAVLVELAAIGTAVAAMQSANVVDARDFAAARKAAVNVRTATAGFKQICFQGGNLLSLAQVGSADGW